MRRVRAWLRAFGRVRLLEDCAASMLLENGAEAEEDLRRAIAARPPLVQRIALGMVLRAVRRQQAETIDRALSSVTPSPLVADLPPARNAPPDRLTGPFRAAPPPHDPAPAR